MIARASVSVGYTKIYRLVCKYLYIFKTSLHLDNMGRARFNPKMVKPVLSEEVVQAKALGNKRDSIIKNANGRRGGDFTPPEELPVINKPM